MREPTRREKVVRFGIVLAAVVALLFYFLSDQFEMRIFIVPGWWW